MRVRYIVVGRHDITMNESIKVQERFGTKGMIGEIADEDITKVKNEMIGIEPDHKLKLGKIDISDLEELIQKTIIFVTIGEKINTPQISYYYEIDTKGWEETAQCCKMPALWICCYSQQNKINASDYLKCIDNLHELAKGLKNPLIILGHVTSELPYFNQNSLTESIVNGYLEEYNSLYFLNATSSYRKLKNLILEWINCSEEKLETNHSREVRQTLYQDNFYNQIPPNEVIYVPLNLFDDEDYAYYNRLGLKTACLGRSYTFLHDERQKIDALANDLRERVPTSFYMPIVTASPIKTKEVVGNQNYKVIQSTLTNRGRNVYIGVISLEGVDYTQDYLRTANGETRIAYFWKQNAGNEGNYYRAEQINEALKATMPEEEIYFNPVETYVATLLGLAGGKTVGYEAIAAEAEFLVAQINAAPKALQSIYGGNTNVPAALMPDILIAAHKLLEVAKADNKSLILIIPYNTNISPHDGNTIYEQLLSLLGTGQNCTLIVPTGEEADKRHHQTIAKPGEINPNVYLQVSQKMENLVGVMYMRSTFKEEMILRTPDSSENPIRLDEKGIIYTRNGTIYSTGLQDDYNNGARNILFRIEDMNIGRWQLQYLPSAVAAGVSIDLWISQKELNPYVELSQSSPFITLGSNSATTNLINIGGYDMASFVVLGSSGRGFNWDEKVSPLCVTQGISLLPFDHSTSGQQIEGTAVAAGLLAGAIASIYDKWQIELEAPYPSSLMMRNIILSHITQFTGVNYPNQSQGYGVFDLELLPKLLNTL